MRAWLMQHAARLGTRTYPRGDAGAAHINMRWQPLVLHTRQLVGQQDAARDARPRCERHSGRLTRDSDQELPLRQATCQGSGDRCIELFPEALGDRSGMRTTKHDCTRQTTYNMTVLRIYTGSRTVPPVIYNALEAASADGSSPSSWSEPSAGAAAGVMTSTMRWGPTKQSGDQDLEIRALR